MPQRIVFPKKGSVELQAFDLGELASDDVLVRTLYSLMSIGTETTILHEKYAPGTHYDKIFSFPQLKTGVQAVGVIEQRGEDVDDFEVGQHIYMRMAHGSHQIMPASLCSLIPDGIDLKDACWAGLAKTAFRAAWAGEFKQRNSLLIVGAGPVGQMLLRWAVAEGVDQILVADLSESRLQHALRGGATEVICGSLANHLEQVAQMNHGSGPPVVVDTTGNPAAFPAALAAAAKFGKVVLLGDSGFPGKQCLTSDVMTKGLTIQATHDSHDLDGWTQRRIDERFFGLVARDKFDLKGLITHEFQPADCVAAYALASDSREQAIGILYDWTKIKE